MKYKITQVNPYIDNKELQYITESIKQQWLTEGPKSKLFLDKILEFTGSKYGVFAPNGTLGLFLGLLALDLPRGSEILIPNFTFFASASSAVFAGLKPVFVDVDYNSFNIDIEKIEEYITEKTKAIMPVHIYGHSVKMDKIIEIANKYNLKIIEDAAQAFGVRYNNQHCGTFGDVSMISFFADKTLTMGEGAVVLTQDEELYKKLKLLRNQGRENSGTFIHPSLGMNFRITDLQAGVGLAQFNKFNEIQEKKLNNYKLYNELLNNIGDLKFLKVEENSTFVPFRFFIKTQYKEKLMQFLEKNGIQTRSFFYPMHKQPPLREFVKSNQTFEISEKLYNEGICLPLHTYLDNKDILYICDKIKEFFEKEF